MLSASKDAQIEGRKEGIEEEGRIGKKGGERQRRGEGGASRRSKGQIREKGGKREKEGGKKVERSG